jgi:hypothetical protein
MDVFEKETVTVLVVLQLKIVSSESYNHASESHVTCFFCTEFKAISLPFQDSFNRRALMHFTQRRLEILGLTRASAYICNTTPFSSTSYIPCNT